METTVTCQICGHSAKYLAKHFKLTHQLTSDEYRQKYPGARIRSEASEAHRKALFKVVHANPSHKGKKKTVTCVCGTTGEIPLSVSAKLFKCSTCKAEIERANKEAEDAKFALLIEGKQYVRCVGCDYRAENLNSHVQSIHPEWVGQYPGQMTALESSIRDKSFKIGTKHTSETIAKMSANAGRWNKGLTIETDHRLIPQREAILKYYTENGPWSKGLTKETEPRLRQAGEKQSQFWASNPEAGEYRRELKFNPTIEDFEPYRLKNGKISLARAIVGLGHCYITVRKACRRLDLPYSRHGIMQTMFLNELSKVLGSPDFEEEWTSPEFINPKTQRCFRYDGYFVSHNLIVEFHGGHHYIFPSSYIKSEKQYFAMQERDRVKENLIHAHPTLRYFVVRQDEPYTNPDYLRYRLEDEGIL